VGRVVTGLPVMTFLGKWLSKTWVIVTILCLAVGWFVGQSVYSYYKNKKKKDEIPPDMTEEPHN